MTERERLLEKIRKVQALANRGADGEKQSAAALLDRLMTQYGIDEAEIAEERLEKCFFRYKTPYERKLLVQVIYTVTGKIPFKCVGSYSGRARKQVGIDCTAAERLEIEFSYEFYKAALEEEMERFYSAFVMKNDIFPPAGRHPYGGYGGYQRDTVCPFPHCGAGGGLVPKLRNRQAFLERIGGRRTDPAGAPGCGRTEPHLHAAPQEGGLP